MGFIIPEADYLEVCQVGTGDLECRTLLLKRNRGEEPVGYGLFADLDVPA